MRYNLAVSGDTASKLSVTCQNESDSAVIDLTGATVDLQWKDEAKILQTRPMTVTDALGGVAEYEFAAGELYAPEMRFQVRITIMGKVIHNLSLIRVAIREVTA